jgi:hypothetical protein
VEECCELFLPGILFLPLLGWDPLILFKPIKTFPFLLLLSLFTNSPCVRDSRYRLSSSGGPRGASIYSVALDAPDKTVGIILVSSWKIPFPSVTFWLHVVWIHFVKGKSWVPFHSTVLPIIRLVIRFTFFLMILAGNNRGFWYSTCVNNQVIGSTLVF